MTDGLLDPSPMRVVIVIISVIEELNKSKASDTRVKSEMLKETPVQKLKRDQRSTQHVQLTKSLHTRRMEEIDDNGPAQKRSSRPTEQLQTDMRHPSTFHKF